MSDIAIKIENLSKMYRLGVIGKGTLKDDLFRLWIKMRGGSDPFIKNSEINERTKEGNSKYVLALNDINFEVKKGERIGIIGRNGAGKSTLLKLLSQVTGPTKGTIRMKGRVASLLEVGTGFHGELTGRENIYLNGTILGMSHKEVSRKLDEIVSFAGVERYIDTPVKRYSSGMTVRLGFAVAAHLEPDILIVDEVLAVGDDEFQNKAIGKMEEVSNKQGRTILFVSHNMEAIYKLCSKTLLIDNGIVRMYDQTSHVVSEYLRDCRKVNSKEVPKSLDVSYENLSEINSSDEAIIRSIRILDKEGSLKDTFKQDEELIIETEVEVFSPSEKLSIGIAMKDKNHSVVFYSTPFDNPYKILFYKTKAGLIKYICRINLENIISGKYFLNIGLGLWNTKALGNQDIHFKIKVEPVTGERALLDGYRRNAKYLPFLDWETIEN